jgi:hypothetical protein
VNAILHGKGQIVLMCNIKEKTYNAKIGIKWTNSFMVLHIDFMELILK